MARSFLGNVKGVLRNMPAGRSARPQETDGNDGCLETLIVIAGMALIVEFWVPLLTALITALIGYLVYRIVVAFGRTRDAESSHADHSRIKSSHIVTSTSYAPAGWYPDPAGVHQHRYWDGSGWSHWVADDGSVNSRPL